MYIELLPAYCCNALTADLFRRKNGFKIDPGMGSGHAEVLLLTAFIRKYFHLYVRSLYKQSVKYYLNIRIYCRITLLLRKI